MQSSRTSISHSECRLCDIGGQHEIDIWDENPQTGSQSASGLSEKIFECIGVRVWDLSHDCPLHNSHVGVCLYISRSNETMKPPKYAENAST